MLFIVSVISACWNVIEFLNFLHSLKKKEVIQKITGVIQEITLHSL